MTDYLISTQSLLDRMTGKSEFAIFDWLKEQRTDRTTMFLSIISVGYAKGRVEGLANATARKKYRFVLDVIVDSFGAKGILNVDDAIADTWSKLIADGSDWKRYVSGRKGSKRVPLSDADLIVTATALEKKLTLVEPAQPYHDELTTYGLKIETLGE